MAEALINYLGADQLKTFSASSDLKGFVYPQTIETLKRHPINPGQAQSQSWDEFSAKHFDLLISVCGNACQSCPILNGNHQKLHWPIP